MDFVRQETNACAALLRILRRPLVVRDRLLFVFVIYFLTFKANDAGPGQMIVGWRFGSSATDCT